MHLLLTVLLLCVHADSYGNEEIFERQVRPILLQHCVECHGPSKQEADVRLDQRLPMLSGKVGDVPLVAAGEVDNSRLAQVIAWFDDDIQMPPDAPLSDVERQAVLEWISSGADWPESVDLEQAARQRAEAWRSHWAFQPVTRPAEAAELDTSSAIDHFIGQRLAEVELDPSPQADARSLVRRLSVALVGLPPDPQEYMHARVAEEQQRLDEWLDAYTDQLLSSPHFGERWARYWMDVARYADTRGYVFTSEREYKDAWRYREWLINALNADMPYDEFLRRQLAADQLPGSDDPAQLAAMGYLTLGRRFLNNIHDIIDDRIDVVSRGMLGLTTSCARCHDHKFDPIPTADYYALYGVFASSDEPDNDPSPLRLVDRDKPVTPFIFQRGNPRNRGEQVTRHFLTALTAPEVREFRRGSGRLELAEAIASAENPLTSRVAVNRIWMHLFGRGLVDSPSDFGVRTPPPSHPELLDVLADSFIAGNWSVKHLIRSIVRSDTWRQSSAARPDAAAIDVENRMLARMNRRRLDFEAHRDAILWSAGTLQTTIGGESVDITAVAAAPRRTVYARIDRQNLPGVFRTFDLASPDQHAPRRYETTVPQQALFQLNHPFMMSQAEHLVESLQGVTTPADEQAMVRGVFQRVLQRAPTRTELLAAIDFIRLAADDQHVGPAAGWSYGCGTFDEADQQVTAFTPLPHFSEGRWSGGSKLPDAAIGWVHLNREGGHTGADLQHCAIRRWTADSDCVVAIGGQLTHRSDQGDGVRGRIVVANRQIAADVSAHNRSRSTTVRDLSLSAGEHIDFVADCRSNESFDSFRWMVQLQQSRGDGSVRTWNSRDDFSDRPPESVLPPLAQLAQTLMMTNEFVFVD